MKKTLIFIAATLCFAAAASAQPKAIGARLDGMGYVGLEASYEHYLGNPHFLEVNAGVWGWNGFSASGIYNFVFAQPVWTTRGDWSWYAGPGVSLGVDSNGDKAKFFFGLAAQVGLEYQFWFPLQLSADLRPVIGFCDGEFYDRGMLGFVPTISVRYAF